MSFFSLVRRVLEGLLEANPAREGGSVAESSKGSARALKRGRESQERLDRWIATRGSEGLEAKYRSAAYRREAQETLSLIRYENRSGQRGEGRESALCALLSESARWSSAVEIIEVLIPHCDPDYRYPHSRLGDTLLMKACRDRSPEAARLLLSLGFCDADATNELGHTATMCAAGLGDAETLQALATPARARATDRDGGTALMRAVRVNCAKSVAILAPLSDPNACNKDGLSALMIAASLGHGELARLLAPLSDLSHKSAQGLSAEQIAREKGHGEIALMIGSLSEGHEMDRALGRGVELPARASRL